MDHWAGLAELEDEAMVELLESIISVEDTRAYTTRLHGRTDPTQPGPQEGSGSQASMGQTVGGPWIPREEDLEVVASARRGQCEDGSPGPCLRDVVGQRHKHVHVEGGVAAEAPMDGSPVWHYMYSPLHPSSLTSPSFPAPPACLCSLPSGGVQVRQANVWMGQSLTSRIHVDGLDNLLVCAVGRKLLHLYPPAMTALLDPAPPDCVPVESQVTSILYHHHRPGAHPQFEKVKRVVADLGPGDALFIPAGWWHEVFTCWEWSLSVNYWCELSHPRCRLRPSLLHISSGGRYTDFMVEKRREEEGKEQGTEEAEEGVQEAEATPQPKRHKTEGS